MNAKRKKAEKLVYDTMDALDKTKSMSKYYRDMFATMDDKAFLKFISRRLPFRFQTRIFKIEPGFNEIKKAADVLKIPIMEKITLPYMYKNSKGEAVQTQPALVGYIHLKKMKQSITKKTGITTDISHRDAKTGRLVSHDKSGVTSDREIESLVINNLPATIKEFTRFRADSMDAKNEMYNTIATLGSISQKDIILRNQDVISKNLLNVYLLGSHLNSNLINYGNYTPRTVENKTISKRERE